MQKLTPNTLVTVNKPAEKCVYCLGKSKDLTFSLEHIWPQSLGGAAGPDVFKTRAVCRSCNSTVGNWVDGAFIKSWFIQNEVGLNAQVYLDPEQPGISSLFYVGFDSAVPLKEGEVCERWIGPAGAHIYHFHQRDDERWTTYAGGNFLSRKKFDPGRAYILLTSQHPYWGITALLSFCAHFANAKRRCLTRIIGDLPVGIDVLAPDADPITPEEAREIEFIYGRPDGQAQQAQLPVKIDFSERFLAKLALGFAYTLLGTASVMSPYADELRSLLWSKSNDERVGNRVQGRTFWQGQEIEQRLVNMVGWSGAWTIHFQAYPKQFGMIILTPGGRMMAMSLSDDPSLWPSDVKSIYGAGATYYVIPERRTFFGPTPLPDILSHKLGHRRHPDLDALEAMKTDPARLPPMRDEA